MKKIRDEYISKQDAVDAVPKERIVEYMDEFGAGYNSCRNDTLRSIESLTPADVVPICQTGCKGCKREYNLVIGSCRLCARLYKDMYEGIE